MNLSLFKWMMQGCPVYYGWEPIKYWRAAYLKKGRQLIVVTPLFSFAVGLKSFTDPSWFVNYKRIKAPIVALCTQSRHLRKSRHGSFLFRKNRVWSWNKYWFKKEVLLCPSPNDGYGAKKPKAVINECL